MRRPTLALNLALAATGLSATVAEAQRPSAPSPPVASSSAEPVDPMMASKATRYLLRNGMDYLAYREYARALSFFRAVEARQKELTPSERESLRKGIARAQQGMREAVNATRVVAQPTKGRGNVQPGAFALAKPSTAESDSVRLASAELPAPPPIHSPAPPLEPTPAPEPRGGELPALPPRMSPPAPKAEPSPDPTSPEPAPALPSPAPDAAPAPAPPEVVPAGLPANAPPPIGLEPPDAPDPATAVEPPAAPISTSTPTPDEPAPLPLPAEPAPFTAEPAPLPAEPPALPLNAPAPTSAEAVAPAEAPIPVADATAAPIELPPGQPTLAPLPQDPAPTSPAPAELAPVADDPVRVAAAERGDSPPAPMPVEAAPVPSDAPATPEPPPAPEASPLPPLPGGESPVAPLGSALPPVPTSAEGANADLDLPPRLRGELNQLAQVPPGAERPGEGAAPPSDPNAPQTPSQGSTRLELVRPPSPTEARPLRRIPVPEEFVPLGAREWTPNRKYWASAAPCHMTLYFQDPVLERYGQGVEQSLGPAGRFFSYPLDDPRQSNQRNQILQPFYSIGKFCFQVGTLPYKLIVDPPNEAEYDLGYYRPGDPIPPDTIYITPTGVGPPLKGRHY